MRLVFKSLLELSKNESEDLVRLLISRVDLDSDGELDINEFRNLLQQMVCRVSLI